MNGQLRETAETVALASARPAATPPREVPSFAPTCRSMEKLTPVDELDQYIYQAEDVFSWDAAAAEDVQTRLIGRAFDMHISRCSGYRAYCERLGIGSGFVRRAADLDAIPLIPTVAFKGNDSPLSVHPDAIVKRCTSSGTEGTISLVHRDEDTLNRFLGGVRKYVDHVFAVEDAIVLNLGPSTEEAEDLWFSYVMSITDMVFPLVNFVSGEVFRPADVLDTIADQRHRYRTVMITGAPIMFLNLLAHMRERDVRLDHGEQIFVVTAGGWKKHENESISRRMLLDQLTDRFRSFRRANLRDTFNMVELNNVMSECEYGRKHVLPWVRVRARNPESFEACRSGEVGLLSFLDPSATSYPAFLLASDLGRVHVGESCACGRKAESVEILRRVRKSESRGCALKMAMQHGARC